MRLENCIQARHVIFFSIQSALSELVIIVACWTDVFLFDFLIPFRSFLLERESHIVKSKIRKSLSPSSFSLTQIIWWSQEEYPTLLWWSDCHCLWKTLSSRSAVNSPPEVKAKTTLLEGSYLPIAIKAVLKLIINICNFWKKRSIYNRQKQPPFYNILCNGNPESL